MSDWIEWNGGDVDVDVDDVIEFKYKNSLTHEAARGWWFLEEVKAQRNVDFEDHRLAYYRVVAQSHDQNDPLKTKQERYTEDGEDLIDEWWEKYPPEIARVIMWEQMNKYNRRLGKKDEIVKEVRKIADYAARWLEKEQQAVEDIDRV